LETYVKVVLHVVDIDGQEMHDIVLDGVAAIPSADDHVTFEVRPGEWITRLVTVRGGYRFEKDAVIVELEVSALDDDEEA
jgi:hypothetical protein